MEDPPPLPQALGVWLLFHPAAHEAAPQLTALSPTSPQAVTAGNGRQLWGYKPGFLNGAGILSTHWDKHDTALTHTHTFTKQTHTF